VRTAVYFAAKDSVCKVVQVTSPNPGDGKTTLVSNLAVSIAQSGKRVVLVDADFRRPRVAEVFGLSAESGLVSVLTDQAEVKDVIRSTPVAGLSILACGPIPPNPAELLNSPRFKELMALLREDYDFVLVDTPPLLAVTDPCIVTACVDGVVLTIRLSKHDRPDAERAKEILDNLSVPVLGIVVNGVGREHHYGGYSGTYAYGYGYADSHTRSDSTAEWPNGNDGKAAPAPDPRRSSAKPARRGFLGRLFHWS
jgi:capsular exopolysaccharide synthesis family protein